MYQNRLFEVVLISLLNILVCYGIFLNKFFLNGLDFHSKATKMNTCIIFAGLWFKYIFLDTNTLVASGGFLTHEASR